MAKPLIPIRKNEGNGFVVASLHYSADPDKDDDWKEVASQNMSEERWAREMEIDWNAAGGTLVYPYFQQCRSKIVIPSMELIPGECGGWFTAGFDHGKLNPTVMNVYWVDDCSGYVYHIWEYYNPGHYQEHAEVIKECPWLSEINGQIWCDPSMSAATQQTATGGFKSIIELYAEEGIHLLPAPRAERIVRAERIGGLWNGGRLDSEDPKFYIFDTCENAIREFRQLRHETWTGATAGKRAKHEGILKKDDHSWDACSYCFSANDFFEVDRDKEDPRSLNAYMRKRLEAKSKSDDNRSRFFLED